MEEEHYIQFIYRFSDIFGLSENELNGLIQYQQESLKKQIIGLYNEINKKKEIRNEFI